MTAGSHEADATGHSATRPTTADRSPEELRQDLGELRAELGDTVEELANRVDVPARVRAKREETVEQLKVRADEATEKVQEQVVHARAVLAEKAPAVEAQLRERPAVVGGIALAVVLLLVRLLRRGKRRSTDGTR